MEGKESGRTVQASQTGTRRRATWDLVRMQTVSSSSNKLKFIQVMLMLLVRDHTWSSEVQEV